MNFYEWITKKYLDWQNELKERRSVTEFAEYVGVAQTTMSAWMQPNGRIPRKLESINRLASRFGTEVYDVLGLIAPYDILSDAPPELQEDFKRALSEANQAYRDAARSGKRLSEADARRILSKALSKYDISLSERE